MNLGIGAGRAYDGYRGLRPSDELSYALLHLAGGRDKRLTKEEHLARVKAGYAHLGVDREGKPALHPFTAKFGLAIYDEVEMGALVIKYMEAMHHQHGRVSAAHYYSTLPSGMRAYLQSATAQQQMQTRFSGVTSNRIQETLAAVMAPK